jgi:hypothetical protein
MSSLNNKRAFSAQTTSPIQPSLSQKDKAAVEICETSLFPQYSNRRFKKFRNKLPRKAISTNTPWGASLEYRLDSDDLDPTVSPSELISQFQFDDDSILSLRSDGNVKISSDMLQHAPGPLTTIRAQEIVNALKRFDDGKKSDLFKATPQSGLLQSLFGFPHEDVIEDLMEECQQLREVVDNKLPEVTSYAEVLKLLNGMAGAANDGSSSKSLYKAGLILCSGAAIGSSIYYFRNEDDLSPIAGIGFLSIAFYCAIQLGLGTEVLSIITSRIASFFPEEMLATPQSGIDITIDSFAVLASAIFGVSKDNVSVLKMITNVRDYARCRNSLQEIVKSVLSSFQSCYNSLCAHIPGMRLIRLLSTDDHRVDSWIKEIDEIFDLFNTGELLHSSSNMVWLHDVIQSGESLSSEFRKERFGQSINTTIRAELKKLKELRAKFLSYRVTGDGSRAEPSCLMLRGGPGIFKSVLVERLADLLVRDSLVSEHAIRAFEEDKRAYIWPSAVETGYDDGYTPTTIVQTQDDFGQGSDVAGNLDNEYMKAIRRNCGFPCLLHPADVKDKGTLYFTAKYCLATTNRQEFSNLPSIKNSQAFLRRWDLDVIVTIKKEYCTLATIDNDIWSRLADRNKLPVDESGNSIVSEEIWEFHMIRETGGNIEDLGLISYLDLVKRVISTKNRKEKEYHSNQRTMQSMNRRTLNQLYGVPEGPIVAVPQSGLAEIQMEDLHLSHTSRYSREVLDRIIDLIEFVKIHEPNWDPSFTMAEVIFKDFFGERDYTLYLEGHLDLIGAMNDTVVHNLVRPIPAVPWTRGFVWRTANEILDYMVNHIPIPDELLAYDRVTRLMAKFTVVLLSSFSFITFLTWFNNRGKKRQKKNSAQSIGISDRMARANVNVKVASAQSLSPSDRLAKPIVSPKVTPQMGNFLDPNGYTKAISDFQRNSYIVNIYNPNGKLFQRMGNLNFIRGTQALVPFHYVNQLLAEVENFPDTLTFKVRISKTSEVRAYEFVLTVNEFLASFVPFARLNENQDIALLDFKELCHNHRDIVENFALESDLTFLTRSVPFVMFFGDVMPVMVPSYASSVLVELPVYSNERDDEHSYLVHKTFTYRLSTVNGDCGALMAVMNPALSKRKYFGMHVAGHQASGVGYSSLVTQEMLQDYLTVMDDVVSEAPGYEILDCNDRVEPQFKLLGRLKPAPSHNTTTSIMPSLLYGNFEPVVTSQAKLKPFVSLDGEVIDPYIKAASKYCNPAVWIDPKVLNLVEDDVFSFIKDTHKLAVNHRLLTWRECLHGIEEDIDSRGIPPSTSAGFPMTCPGFINYKKLLFSQDRDTPEWINVFESLVQQCEKVESDLVKGIRHLHVYTDNLKDERRPIEKVISGSTRLFSGSPFIYLMLKKRYFGTFILEFQKNRIFNSSGVGVNPYSSEWDLMANLLGKFSKKGDEILVGAGDYERFDGSQVSRIHHSILRVINRCYDDENSFARKMLWLEIVNSRHVYKGLLTEWCNSMPSGNLLTILINCFYNMYAFRFCWHYAGIELSLFSKNVVLFVVGDDNIFSVSPKFQDVFNELTLCDLMKKIGLSYTLETKGSATQTFRDLTEVEFLKRSFRWDSDVSRYVAPLRLSVILDIPNWTKHNCPDLIAVANIDECSKELSLHSRAVFQKYNSKLVKAKELYYPDFETNLSLYMNYLVKKKIVLAIENYFPS